MKKTFYLSFALVMLSLLCLTAGCSDFDEMKSQRALINAEAMMEQGREEDAMQALSDLIAKYPATQSGEVAKNHLVQIQNQRERRMRIAVAKVLDSYRQVFYGYYSIYNEYPRSLADLDESGYFFDEAYLEEVTPDGYTVYLLLSDDGSGYRLWGVIEENEWGYTLSSDNSDYVKFDVQDQVEELRESFDSESWGGSLVLLQSKE